MVTPAEEYREQLQNSMVDIRAVFLHEPVKE